MLPTAQGNDAPNFLTPRAGALVALGALLLLALANYLPPLVALGKAVAAEGSTRQLADRDFVNYWMGGQTVRTGQVIELFDHDRYVVYLQAAIGAQAEARAWSYPPHYLLLMWPLGLLEYESALLAFLGVTLAMFLAAAWLLRQELAPQTDPLLPLLAIAGFALMLCVTTQNGFLTGALTLTGFALARSRPLLAGLAFALLTTKPQLGLLLPVLLIFERRWRTIGWTVVWTMLLVGVSVWLFGTASWTAYLTKTIPYQGSVMTDWHGVFLSMMPTPFGSLRAYGYSSDIAMRVQVVVSIATLAAVIFLLARERDTLPRLFVVCAGTFLLTPYAFNYDMGALTVVAALLAARSLQSPNAWTAIGYALIAGLAAATIPSERAGFRGAPLVLAAALLLAYLDSRRRSRNVGP